jgi:hypothetical protein
VIHRLHGIVCEAIHRAALRGHVVEGCEGLFGCRWVRPEAPGELHWFEVDERNGEVDLWTDCGGTLVSVDLNGGFSLGGRRLDSSGAERLLAASLACRLHRPLWGVELRGRRSVRYTADDRGLVGPDEAGDAYDDPATVAWIGADARRGGARCAVGEDEYVRAFIESYRLRRDGAHHRVPPERVEERLREDYRREFAAYEGHEADAETLFFAV